MLGGGVVGTNAARMAMGLEAHVTVLDLSLRRLNELDLAFGAMLNTVFSTIDSIEEHVTGADLVIGGVLLPGAAAPKLITKKMVEQMKKGSVIVDVAIDQGGCAETSHATTHANPTYLVNGVVHYAVANMPGGVARTSTFALNNATLRRGVLTGTVMQAMAVTVPVGAFGFLALAIILGAMPELLSFPLAAALWMAGQGIVRSGSSEALVEFTPLAALQAANDPQRPLDSLQDAECNRTLAKIARAIGEHPDCSEDRLLLPLG